MCHLDIANTQTFQALSNIHFCMGCIQTIPQQIHPQNHLLLNRGSWQDGGSLACWLELLCIFHPSQKSGDPAHKQTMLCLLWQKKCKRMGGKGYLAQFVLVFGCAEHVGRTDCADIGQLNVSPSAHGAETCAGIQVPAWSWTSIQRHALCILDRGA